MCCLVSVNATVIIIIIQSIVDVIFISSTDPMQFDLLHGSGLKWFQKCPDE